MADALVSILNAVLEYIGAAAFMFIVCCAIIAVASRRRG